MNTENYIKDILSDFTDQFSDIKISYYVNELSGTHILQFERNEEISEEIECFQADVLFDFIEEFPYQSLLFCTDLKPSKLHKLIYQEVGKDYSERWVTFESIKEDIKIDDDYRNPHIVIDASYEELYALAA